MNLLFTFCLHFIGYKAGCMKVFFFKLMLNESVLSRYLLIPSAHRLIYCLDVLNAVLQAADATGVNVNKYDAVISTFQD